MKLGTNELKMMITECVQRILEYHGAIDDRLMGLAELIIKRVKSGEDKFTLKRNELEQYYPYKNVPESLNVSVQFLKPGAEAAYSQTTNTIKVSPSVRYLSTNEYFTEVLMHELTHFVNNNEGGENLKKWYPEDLGSNGPGIVAKKIEYLFDPSEMQARATQFKWRLKNSRGERKFSDFNNVTGLKTMKTLIDIVENDVQPESDSEPLSVVELLMYQRGNKKSQLDGRTRFLNPSPKDFEKAKKAIVKKLKMAYNVFFKKVSKIFYDETTQY